MRQTHTGIAKWRATLRRAGRAGLHRAAYPISPVWAQRSSESAHQVTTLSNWLGGDPRQLMAVGGVSVPMSNGKYVVVSLHHACRTSERGQKVTDAPYGPVVGSPKDLASSPTQKKAAARAIEEHIEPETREAGDWADEETEAAVKAFAAKDGDGWVTSTALKKAHKTWGDQVQALMHRLGSEKLALRSTGLLFQTTDFGIGHGIRTSSSLDNY